MYEVSVIKFLARPFPLMSQGGVVVFAMFVGQTAITPEVKYNFCVGEKRVQGRGWKPGETYGIYRWHCLCRKVAPGAPWLL